MILHIQNIEDVKTFARKLFAEGVSVHPDEDFHDYINADNTATFTPEEAEKRNKLMDQCFEICDSAGEDIYGLMHEIYQQKTGSDRSVKAL